MEKTMNGQMSEIKYTKLNRETEFAVNIMVKKDNKTVWAWLPKSQILLYKVHKTIELPVWLKDKKGL
jgi:hypothetical protein